MAQVPLLEDEEIISSTECDPIPTFLTKKGWLAFYNGHSIKSLSKLHRVLHVSQIKSLQMSDKNNKILEIFMAIIILCSMSYASYLFVVNFGLQAIIDSSTFVSSYNPDQDILNVVDDIIFAWCYVPFGVCILFGIIQPSKPSKLIIKFDNEDGIESDFELSESLAITSWTVNAALLFSLIMYLIINGGGFQELMRYEIIISLIIFFLFLKRQRIIEDFSLSELWNGHQNKHFVERRLENETAILTGGGPVIKFKKLNEFHMDLTIFLEIEGTQDMQQVPGMSNQMPPEFNRLKERVESHDSILSQIVVHYDHIFISPTPWLSCSAVRSSTEKLLSFRVKKILPKAPKNKNLSDFRNLLNKNDVSLTGNILRDIDQISVLGNNAVHNMEASTSDYMSMLEKFVNVVDWHISNPPTSIVNDDE